MKKNFIVFTIAYTLIGLGAGCNQQPYSITAEQTDTKEESVPSTTLPKTLNTPPSSTITSTTPTTASAGTYEAFSADKLARATNGSVILFFKADWCPTCRTLDADIKKHLSSIPPNTHILIVNYDTARELKQRYGVTYQHTLVHVDETGRLLSKWSGSPTLADILTHLK